MQAKIKTEPTIEPVTVTDVKTHLRIDSGTFAENISEELSIDIDTYSAGTSTGTGIDVQGYNVVANINAGEVAAGASMIAHLEESDDDSTYEDVSGSTFTTISTGNQNVIVEEAYTGVKQYVRVIGTIAGGNVVYGANVVKYAATSAEDTYIGNLITVARQMVEEYLRRALITQTWYYYLNNWPESDEFIYLPFGNLQNGTAPIITYTDSDGDGNIFSSDDYIVDTASNLGRIVLGYGEGWPTDTLYPSNPIVIEYLCGYGTSKTDIPLAIRHAIMMIVGELYERRENTTTYQTYQLPIAAERLLYPYRLWLPEQDGDL